MCRLCADYFMTTMMVMTMMMMVVFIAVVFRRASPIRAGTTIGGDGVSPRRQLGVGAADDVELTRPVERQVEARSADDVSGSIVRTLYFADTFLMNGPFASSSSPVFWHAPLGVCSAKCRHQSPGWSVLSHMIASFGETFFDYRSCWVHLWLGR